MTTTGLTPPFWADRTDSSAARSMRNSHGTAGGMSCSVCTDFFSVQTGLCVCVCVCVHGLLTICVCVWTMDAYVCARVSMEYGRVCVCVRVLWTHMCVCVYYGRICVCVLRTHICVWTRIYGIWTRVCVCAWTIDRACVCVCVRAHIYGTWTCGVRVRAEREQHD